MNFGLNFGGYFAAKIDKFGPAVNFGRAGSFRGSAWGWATAEGHSQPNAPMLNPARGEGGADLRVSCVPTPPLPTP